MRNLDKMAWEVLNTTADDFENLEQIYRSVCYELIPTPESSSPGHYDYRPIPGAPLLSEIADCVHRLVEQRLLTAVMDDNGNAWTDAGDLTYVWRAWFKMTPEGRSAWELSDDLVEQE